MWGGCFTQKTASSLAEINSSIDIDKRMYKEDLEASCVYAKALMKIKIINPNDYAQIAEGLNKVFYYLYLMIFNKLLIKLKLLI